MDPDAERKARSDRRKLLREQRRAELELENARAFQLELAGIQAGGKEIARLAPYVTLGLSVGITMPDPPALAALLTLPLAPLAGFEVSGLGFSFGFDVDRVRKATEKALVDAFGEKWGLLDRAAIAALTTFLAIGVIESIRALTRLTIESATGAAPG